MASETSAVLVAVRVRPFSAKEDPVSSTIVVPDSSTITVVDVPTLFQYSDVTSGVTNSANTSGGGGGGLNTNTAAALDRDGPAKHHYTFDKIFWSVPPSALPLPPTLLNTSGGKYSAMETCFKKYGHHLPCFVKPPPYEDQQLVYDYIGPRMSDAAMKGYNACLFAYGQTGSGKSYSMIGASEKLNAASMFVAAAAADRKTSGASAGSDKGRGASGGDKVLNSDLGIMPRLSQKLFQLMKEEREKDESVSYTVEVSFLEIYCEKVRDLLATAAGGNSANTHNAAMKVRQHPSLGPYVEGLSHINVKNETQVMQNLLHGLRERATAETQMNEHSSRSHAILQLHLTKVTVIAEEAGVTTKTRVCKVNMVDLAGSERVTQSGVTGDRFEEAKNINLSLSTLGRVIQQLSEKQQGHKNVIPAYRDSVLTWLLSDSLGGNSKTIMLATVAPSAYCYQQTLNTLRFAGVAKKVINVATVNEDQHFQKLIAELRQQIVRLTLQMESGKGSETLREEVARLKEENDEVVMENEKLKLKVAKMGDTEAVEALRRRVAELEESNDALQKEKLSLQQRLLSSTTQLREELAEKRAELLKMQDQLSSRDNALADWSIKYRALEQQHVLAVAKATAAAAAAGGGGGGGGGGGASPTTAGGAGAPAPVVASSNRDEAAQLRKKVQTLSSQLAAAQRSLGEAQDLNKSLQGQLEDYKMRYTENNGQLAKLHERMEKTLGMLEIAQCQLAARHFEADAESVRASEAQEQIHNAQMEQLREDYLSEKQSNVQLLLKTSQVEQERAQLKKQLQEHKADIMELEQMLLEETENSERYYLRLRHQRTVTDLQEQLCRRIALSSTGAGNSHHTNDGRRKSSSNLNDTFNTMGGGVGIMGMSPYMTPRNAGGGPDFSMNNSLALSRGASSWSPTAGDPLAQSLSQQHTYELMFAQLEYECLCDEAQARGLIEQEYMAAIIRLLAKKTRLKEGELAETGERYHETQDKLSITEQELAYYKKELRAAEERGKELADQQALMASAAEQAQGEQLRLTRRLRQLEEAQDEAERAKASLVEKVAALQDETEQLRQRCRDAERLAEEAQAYLGGAGSNSNSALLGSPHSSNEAAAGGEGGGEYNSHGAGRPSQRMRAAIEHGALDLKERELAAAREEIQRLTQECEAYRAEVGELRAVTDRAAADRIEHREQLHRETQLLEKQRALVEGSKAQMSQLMNDTVKDYEKRIVQQQEMMNTLRHALEEETKLSDACREAAQRAEAERMTAEEEAQATRDANDELRREQRTAEAKYSKLQKELDDLRLQYNVLERQLMELKVREPQLYLLLEKSAAEDSAAWIDKARREKANLQKQKLEAKRLNAELLEHVRRRNSHLRDVQQQVQDLSLAATTTSREEEAEDYEGVLTLPSSIHSSALPTPSGLDKE